MNKTLNLVAPFAFAVFLASCRGGESVSAPAKTTATAADSSSAESFVGESSPFLTTTVADVRLDVTGPFRPGSSVRVTAYVLGKHGGNRRFAELQVTDGGNIRGLASGHVKRRELSLADGQSLEIVDEVIFEKPGYYALTVGVWAHDQTQSRMVSDSVLLSHSVASAWVLVDDRGGRLDRKYDVRFMEEGNDSLSSGSVGAFRIIGPPIDSIAMPSSISRSSVNPTMTGVVTFVPADSGAVPRQAILGALIVGNCKVGSISVGYYSVATDWLGRFTATCPSGSTSFQGQVKLEASSHRIYLYSLSVPVNTNFNIAANATDTLTILSDAAKVFINHAWNGAAPYLFGRSRGQMRYVVHSGVAGSSHYNPSADVIHIYSGSVWGGHGEFDVAHEYGHAFHYTAIDPWSSLDCSPGGAGHSFNSVETSSCAYVEGFADFFAAVMLRGRPPASQTINIDSLEIGIYRNVGQGLFVEHAFAATLWDLFDDILAPDSQSGDDENLFMYGWQIGDIMLRCRLYSPGAYLLSHSDQFTYCAEGAVNSARFMAPVGYQSGWGVYGAPLSYDGGTPSLPNLADFRAVWRHNYYGI